MAQQPEAFTSSKIDYRETPRWLARVLEREFRFTLDAAASPNNAIVKHWLGIGGAHEDAMMWNWAETAYMLGYPVSIFCNPPWGRRKRENGYSEDLTNWCYKAYEAKLEGATVVMLLPSKTETQWFQAYAPKASEIRFFDSRIHYELDGMLPLSPKKNPDDPDKIASSPIGSLLLIFRPDIGVQGGPRISFMSADPEVYGKEAVELWKKSRPTIKSSTTQRGTKAAEDTTPGTLTTGEPESR